MLRDLLSVVDPSTSFIFVWRSKYSNQINGINDIEPKVRSYSPDRRFIIFKCKPNQQEENHVKSVGYHKVLVVVIELFRSDTWPHILTNTFKLLLLLFFIRLEFQRTNIKFSVVLVICIITCIECF